MKAHNVSSFTSSPRSSALPAGRDPKRSLWVGFYEIRSPSRQRPWCVVIRTTGTCKKRFFATAADAFAYSTELTARSRSRARPSEEAEGARGLAQAGVAALALIHRGIGTLVPTIAAKF